MKEFKYHQTFATKSIRIVVPEDKSKQLALASLDSLKSVLPADINVTENPDLVFNCFNAACVNLVNLNDDAITTDTAIAIYKNFNRKFIDIEHNRKFIVGTIISSGFSEKFTNRLLTEDEVKGSNKPFNITLGGVVWSIVNPKFSDQLIESSDDSSSKYESISASWEIGFNEYHIALGSKDLAQAEIITDPIQVKEFESMLRINQGFGKTKDGVPVYRIIAGDALPLGIGYTTTPAADVKGVAVANLVKTHEQEIIEVLSEFNKRGIESSQVIAKLSETLANIADTPTQKNIEEKEKNNSHLRNVTVNNNSIMKKFTKLEDITDENLQEATAASVTNFIGKYVGDEIDRVSSEYAEKIELKEKEAKAKEEAAKAIQKQLDETLAEVKRVKEELQQEQETRAAQKLETDFNNRMADLDAQFDLDDKDRSFITSDIRTLDDKAYASWFEKFEVFAAAKKKGFVPFKKKGETDPEDDPKNGGDNGADEDAEDAKDKKKKKAAKASAEDLLNDGKENESKLPPNNVNTDISMKEEYAEAFNFDAFKINK